VAAADEDPISRMWLARCYSTGRMGFERDPGRARAMAADIVATIRDLASHGEAEALFLMGTAYDEALGVVEDPAEAAAWYRRAADAGHVLAAHNMGNLHAAGRGVRQSDEQAVAWWRKAAEQGDAIPMLRLGTMYEEGRGVPRDLEQAKAWYARAASRGNAQAKAALARLGAWHDQSFFVADLATGGRPKLRRSTGLVRWNLARVSARSSADRLWLTSAVHVSGRGSGPGSSRPRCRLVLSARLDQRHDCARSTRPARTGLAST